VALEKILKHLPSDIGVPILIVQHMPPTFTKMLAQTLNEKNEISICEGIDGDKIEPNRVVLAQGGIHMTVKTEGRTKRVIDLDDSPPRHGVKPSADVLFDSVSRSYKGSNVLAVVLTGMGRDGTEGVRELKDNCNCYCITQSKKSCVVYGMPKSVYEAGLSDEAIHINDIAERILDIVSDGG